MLEGRIHHRLNLHRAQDKKDANEESTAAAKKNDTDDEHILSKNQAIPAVEVGFYLVVQHPLDITEEYLLSIPQHLRKQACDAARFHQTVKISDYTILPLQSSRKRASDTVGVRMSGILEIHKDGLELISPRDHAVDDFGSADEFLTLEKVSEKEITLADQQNHVKEQANQKKGKKRKRGSSSLRYNLTAVVDATSPVIYVEEPFALMELYDEQSTRPYSCVVVFQGMESLLCHEGIFPGDIIALKQVKRQRWKIPDEVLQRKAFHLRRRVPTHVFVLTDATSVVWKYSDSRLPSIPSTPIPLVSLQGEVISREWAARGSATQSFEDSYMIHSIEIRTLPEEKTGANMTATRHVLFLTYYPMAPALTFSLRTGALVRAVNIHVIGKAQKRMEGVGDHVTVYYGACLRSTVSILQMPPPSEDPTNSKGCQNQEKNMYDYNTSRPYAFLAIQRSYLEYACRKMLYEWYHLDCNFEKFDSCGNETLPSFNELAKLWWTHFSGTFHERKARNPYTEFFDHACDNTSGGNGKEDSQHATTATYCQRDDGHDSMFQLEDAPRHLPHWISLSDLHQNCYRDFQERLERTIQLGVLSTKSPVGRTASVYLDSAQVLQILTKDGASAGNFYQRSQHHAHGKSVYTGGVMMHAQVIDQRIASAYLAESNCMLPVTVLVDDRPIYTSEKKETFGDSKNSILASFAFGGLHGVVLSCIYLGRALGRDKISDQKPSHLKAHIKRNTLGTVRQSDTVQEVPLENPYKKNGINRTDLLPLPPFASCAEYNNEPSLGSCSLLQTNGLMFLISIQFVFDELLPISPMYSTKPEGVSHVAVRPSHKSDKDLTSPQKPNFYTVRQCLDPYAPGALDNDNNIRAGNSQILGILVRQRFRLSKISDNQYGGCILTVSHVPIEQDMDVGKCMQASELCLQSVEVKTILHYVDLSKKRDFLRKTITKLLLPRTTVGDDPATIALAWWKVADDTNICALTAGGWDDFIGDVASNASDMAIVVQLPVTAYRSGEVRGYKRFSCSMQELKARFRRTTHTKDKSSLHRVKSSKSSVPLDWIGGSKWLPGMLDRRPLRKVHKADVVKEGHYPRYPPTFGKTIGELVAFPPTLHSGISQCSLIELFRSVCLDLQRQSSAARNTASGLKNHNIAPSLVRHVTRASFLGISFCQAQAACSKCFASLRLGRRSKDQTTNQHKSTSKDKEGRYREGREQQPSFWHCPLPIPGTETESSTTSGLDSVNEDTSETRTISAFEKAKLPVPGADTGNSTTSGADSVNQDTSEATSISAFEEAKQQSNLRCPNGCSVEWYGEIKWECSGTLDDGTGQAKLYAERETAAMLLGMSQGTIETIEVGAWKQTTGTIVFSKTMPPPSHLAKAVEAANFRYQTQLHFEKRIQRQPYKNVGQAERSNVLQYLDPVDRAIYLLHQHCRRSQEVTRPLDYLVRCKPLADNVIHLNHTEIEVNTPGPREGNPSVSYVATYSLPPLKLNLVDCCSAAASGSSIVEETWQLLQAMHD